VSVDHSQQLVWQIEVEQRDEEWREDQEVEATVDGRKHYHMKLEHNEVVIAEGKLGHRCLKVKRLQLGQVVAGGKICADKNWCQVHR
jgi:hypothetical protein